MVDQWDFTYNENQRMVWLLDCWNVHKSQNSWTKYLKQTSKHLDNFCTNK